jgi:hypothetical protein
MNALNPHKTLLPELIVLTVIWMEARDRGKLATAAHVKRMARDFGRKRPDWRKVWLWR